MRWALLTALWGFVVQAAADADALPLFVGEGPRDAAREALVFVDDRPPVIPWSKGGVELAARDSVDGVDG